MLKETVGKVNVATEPQHSSHFIRDLELKKIKHENFQLLFWRTICLIEIVKMLSKIMLGLVVKELIRLLIKLVGEFTWFSAPNLYELSERKFND